MDKFNELLKQFDETDHCVCPSAGVRILVIDDNYNIQQALKRTLIYRKYEVVLKSTGQAGIDALDNEIDVVILDVKLPFMSGIDVYRKLKEKNPDIPIIFYSAYPGNEKLAQQCRSLNPYAFIEKGVTEKIDTLFQAVESASKK